MQSGEENHSYNKFSLTLNPTLDVHLAQAITARSRPTIFFQCHLHKEAFAHDKPQAAVVPGEVALPTKIEKMSFKKACYIAFNL